MKKHTAQEWILSIFQVAFGAVAISVAIALCFAALRWVEQEKVKDIRQIVKKSCKCKCAR